MTNHPTPPAVPVALPTALEQYAARARARGTVSSGFAMLTATAALWGGLAASVGVVGAMPAPVFAPAAIHPPLPRVRFLPKPDLAIALAQRPAPAAQPRAQMQRQRDQQHIRADLLSLLGHVAQSLLKDEFETIVLRLSLGEQVVVHLKNDFLQK